MRLSDIEQGGKIVLQVRLGEQMREFTVELKYIKNNALFTDVIRMNSRIVGFSGNGVHTDLLYYKKDALPVIWKAVVCDVVSVDGEELYRIKVNSEGTGHNRRESFRIHIGVGGVAQVGVNKKPLDVLVKDISETGFAFVYNSDLDIEFPHPIRVVFSDMGESFSLIGLIVRKVPIDSSKTVYGCKIAQKSQKISRYINQKQRKQIAMNKSDSMDNEREQFSAALKEYEEKGISSVAGGEKITGMDSDRQYKKKMARLYAAKQEIAKGNSHLGEVDIATRRRMFKKNSFNTGDFKKK